MLNEGKHPVRVLHVTSVEKSSYFFENLVDYSDRLAVEFTVATLTGEGPFATELRKRNINVYCLDCGKRSAYPRAVRHLYTIIRRHNIDVVHTHLLEPTWVGLAAAKLAGKAVIMTRHHSDALYLIENRLKRWAHLRLEQCTRAMADYIIAVSTCVKEILLNRERMSAAKVSVIPLGQDVRRFEAVTEMGIARVKKEFTMEQRPVLVCVSRLDRWKGHVYLFEVVSMLKREFPGLTLYLLGEGPYRPQLETSVQQAGIASCVRFLGWRDDALEIMAAADVVVHPSLTEALSSVIIEAIALSKPVIASDVSGVRETIMGHGTIVPPADSNALLLALRSTLGNLDAANRLAAGGRAHVLKSMAASNVAQAHVDIYRSVLSRRRG